MVYSAFGSDSTMETMKHTLQEALDDLVSSRTSTRCKDRSLGAVEQILATICVPGSRSSDQLQSFLVLQDSFECNVPSRILSWMSPSTARLEYLISKGTHDHERETESLTLASQLTQALTIVQGVVLNHKPSKMYLGRKYSLEVLLDLLLASRHLSTAPLTAAANTRPRASSPATPTSPSILLASAILDTLLCILVDSSAALRAFEDVNGVQVVVKILKRAGTAREVRMKCLEFLYFYLLDETVPSVHEEPHVEVSPPVSPTPTAPSSPIQYSNHRSLASRALDPYLPSSNFSVASGSSTSSSGSSSSSFSDASSSSAATSVSGFTPGPCPRSPPITPPLNDGAPVPRSLLKLRNEDEYVPYSPKNVSINVSGHRLDPTEPKLYTPYKGQVRNLLRQCSEPDTPISVVQSPSFDNDPVWRHVRSRTLDDLLPEKRKGHEKARTTEEKKEILGRMLGNVDALLEGVRKAGIWGLG